MMPLRFTNGAYNRATGTLDAFGALSDDLVAEGCPAMVSRSGDREIAGQVAMFVSRYRQQASGSGSFGDVRTWNGAPYGYPGGTRWVRFSPAGTVAPPGKSNHEKRRSNDLLYPYNNRNTRAHKRARALAPRHNITWEGVNFDEDWHWTHWGPLGTISNSGGAPAGNEEDDMYTDEDRKRDQETHDRVKMLVDYVGANGGMNTPTADTLGEQIKTIRTQTQETRDNLGARGGMNTKTPDSIGYKIDQLFERWVGKE